MALVPPVVAAALLENMAGNSILGISAVQLATAISVGWCSYMVSAPVVTTADAGSLGAGVGNGVGLIVPPVSLFQSLQSAFISHGVSGSHGAPLANAVSLGLCQSLLAAQILTAAAGTGVGAGKVVAVLPNPGVSIPTMVSSFAGAGIAGISSLSLASAIAQGFDQVLPTAQGQVIIVGAGSPFPGGGAGVGKIY